MSDDQRITSAEIREITTQLEARYKTLINDLELRKWCVEKALEELKGPSGVYMKVNDFGSVAKVITSAPLYAQAIYEFVTAKLSAPAAPETSA